MDDFGEIPIGLTGYDEWVYKLFVILVTNKLVNITNFHELDYSHWYTYYDLGYTPQEAFEEDITYWMD